MRRIILLAAVFLAVPVTAAAQGRVAEMQGRDIAQRWCAACHVVAPDQGTGTAAVPTFMEIARRPAHELSALEGFLADPHPAMPDMSLTREEIRALLAYIGTL